MDKTARLNAARNMVTPGLYRFFQAEWSNEHNGGVSPATLKSAIDSLGQAPEVFEQVMNFSDLAALTLIRDYLPGSTRLTDLAEEDGITAMEFAAREAESTSAA